MINEEGYTGTKLENPKDIFKFIIGLIG